jgi:hypothetical protein
MSLFVQSSRVLRSRIEPSLLSMHLTVPLNVGATASAGPAMSAMVAMTEAMVLLKWSADAAAWLRQREAARRLAAEADVRCDHAAADSLRPGSSTVLSGQRLPRPPTVPGSGSIHDRRLSASGLRSWLGGRFFGLPLPRDHCPTAARPKYSRPRTAEVKVFR